MQSQTTAVHRCRFVDFDPSPITALALPPLPLPSLKGKSKETLGNTTTSGIKFGTLAVGHANGNIDLCEWTTQAESHSHQSAQAWVVRKTLAGPLPSKIDSLAFSIRYMDTFPTDQVPACTDLRLFSSGGGSEVVEWDLAQGCVMRSISSQGGSIWSIAINPASSLLALGCEDGSVRLLSLMDDTLSHHKRFDRVKSRLLSIAWGPPIPRENSTRPTLASSGDTSDEDDTDDWSDSWLVTGGSDSSLRKWDVGTGRVIDRMGADKVRGENTLIWAVGVFGDGTIVSGDSLGMVKFWDSRTCTQSQSFQAHGADVLCLVIGSEGKVVYTSGVDQKIAQFALVKASSSANPPSLLKRPTSRWVHTTSRRLHSHDVRSLASWPPYTPLPPSHKRSSYSFFPKDISPILASGGLDMSMVLTPCALATTTVVTKVVNPLCTSVDATFEEAYQRRVGWPAGAGGLGGAGGVKVARSARLMVCLRDTGVGIWSIRKKKEAEKQEGGAPDTEENGGWDKVLDMELNVSTNLVAAAISDDGRWLVVSDLNETKLFSLTNDANGDLNPKRVRNLAAVLQPHMENEFSNSTGGRAFCFTPDSSKLVMTTAFGAYVLIIELGPGAQDVKVLKKFNHHRMSSASITERVMKGMKKRATPEGEDVEMATAQDEPSEPESSASGGATSATACILRAAVSNDGQWLATSDDHARTHIFNLDLIQHHCVLPSFPHPIHALGFDPSHPNTLIMGFPNNTIQIFDVETRQFPSWSKDIQSTLPKRFTQTDPILGVTFDPAPQSRHALFWGSTWLCKVKLDGGPLGPSALRHSSSKKRRRHSQNLPEAEREVFPEEHQPHREARMITHYRPILCLEFLSPGEMVVVERPLVDVIAKLPPAYFKHKYGAS